MNNEIPTEAPPFSLNGLMVPARIVSVYDGDTFHCIFEFNGKFYNWTCRLDGIDTPEMRSKNPKEKEHAILARDKLRELILGKVVTVKLGEFDKYGRVLANILLDEVDISNELIRLGFGKPYDGGKKSKWVF
jgi:micrococcal nuclease